MGEAAPDAEAVRRNVVVARGEPDEFEPLPARAHRGVDARRHARALRVEHTPGHRKRSDGARVRISDLIAAGLLVPGEQLTGRFKGTDHIAIVEADGQLHVLGKGRASIAVAGGEARQRTPEERLAVLVGPARRSTPAPWRVFATSSSEPDRRLTARCRARQRLLVCAACYPSCMGKRTRQRARDASSGTADISSDARCPCDSGGNRTDGATLDLRHETRLVKSALLYADHVTLASPKALLMASIAGFGAGDRHARMDATAELMSVMENGSGGRAALSDN